MSTFIIIMQERRRTKETEVKIYHYNFKLVENFCLSIPDQPEFRKFCSALGH